MAPAVIPHLCQVRGVRRVPAGAVWWPFWSTTRRQSAAQAAAAAQGLLANVDPGVLLDRTTNEDRRDDWEMKIAMIVLVDPQAPPPPGAPATPTPPGP